MPTRDEIEALAQETAHEVRGGAYTPEALARDRKKALLYLVGRGRLEFDTLGDADKELLGLTPSWATRVGRVVGPAVSAVGKFFSADPGLRARQMAERGPGPLIPDVGESLARGYREPSEVIPQDVEGLPFVLGRGARYGVESGRHTLTGPENEATMVAHALRKLMELSGATREHAPYPNALIDAVSGAERLATVPFSIPLGAASGVMQQGTREAFLPFVAAALMRGAAAPGVSPVQFPRRPSVPGERFVAEPPVPGEGAELLPGHGSQQLVPVRPRTMPTPPLSTALTEGRVTRGTEQLVPVEPPVLRPVPIEAGPERRAIAGTKPIPQGPIPETGFELVPPSLVRPQTGNVLPPGPPRPRALPEAPRGVTHTAYTEPPVTVEGPSGALTPEGVVSPARGTQARAGEVMLLDSKGNPVVDKYGKPLVMPPVLVEPPPEPLPTAAEIARRRADLAEGPKPPAPPPVSEATTATETMAVAPRRGRGRQYVARSDETNVDVSDPEELVSFLRARGGLRPTPDIPDAPIYALGRRGVYLDEIAEEIAKAQGKSVRDVEREIGSTLGRIGRTGRMTSGGAGIREIEVARDRAVPPGIGVSQNEWEVLSLTERRNALRDLGAREKWAASEEGQAAGRLATEIDAATPPADIAPALEQSQWAGMNAQQRANLIEFFRAESAGEGGAAFSGFVPPIPLPGAEEEERGTTVGKVKDLAQILGITLPVAAMMFARFRRGGGGGRRPRPGGPGQEPFRFEGAPESPAAPVRVAGAGAAMQPRVPIPTPAGHVEPSIQASLAGLPPVPDGHIRLYRVEEARTGQSKLPEWLQQARDDAGITNVTGRWYTDAPEMLEWYAREADRPTFSYVDVPRASAEAYRIKALPEGHPARRFSRDPDTEFFLTRQMATGRREFAVPKAPRFAPKVEAAQLPLGAEAAPAPRVAKGERPVWADEFEAVGGKIEPDGTAVLYHATTADKAAQIVKDGVLRRPSDAPDSYGVYLSSSRDVSRDYGDGTVVPVRVRVADLHLDDAFPGRRLDFTIPTTRGEYRPVALGDAALPPESLVARSAPAERALPARGVAVETGLTAADYARASPFIPADVLAGSGEEAGYVLGVRDALAGKQEPNDPNLGGAVQSAIYKGFRAVRAAMRTEPTALGDQGLISGTPARAMPTGKIAPERPQRPIEDTPLFGQEKAARDEAADQAQGKLFGVGAATVGAGAGALTAPGAARAEHEQSETVERDGRFLNVYGRGTAQAGQPLPVRYPFERESYDTLEEAVQAARRRSSLEERFPPPPALPPLGEESRSEARPEPVQVAGPFGFRLPRVPPRIPESVVPRVPRATEPPVVPPAFRREFVRPGAPAGAPAPPPVPPPDLPPRPAATPRRPPPEVQAGRGTAEEAAQAAEAFDRAVPPDPERVAEEVTRVRDSARRARSGGPPEAGEGGGRGGGGPNREPLLPTDPPGEPLPEVGRTARFFRTLELIGNRVIPPEEVVRGDPGAERVIHLTIRSGGNGDLIQRELLDHLDTITEGFTPAQVVRVGRMLDGAPDALSPRLRGLADLIRTEVLDAYADSTGLPRGQRLTDYFPRFRDTVQVEGTKLVLDPTGDPYLSKTVQEMAGRFEPFFHRHRTANDPPTHEGLEALRIYAKATARHLTMNGGTHPLTGEVMPGYLNELQAAINQPIAEAFKPYLADVVNYYLGTPGSRGRLSESLPRSLVEGTRQGSRIVRQVETARLMGANVGSIIKNTFQQLNTLAYVRPDAWLQGYRDLLDSDKRALARRWLGGEDVSKMDLDAVRQTGSVLDKVEGLTAKVAHVSMKGFAFGETQGNRYHAFLAGLREAERLGIEGRAAIEYARDLVDTTQFPGTPAARIPAFRGPVGATVGQFKSYQIRQTAFVKNLIMDDWADWTAALKGETHVPIRVTGQELRGANGQPILRPLGGYGTRYLPFHRTAKFLVPLALIGGPDVFYPGFDDWLRERGVKFPGLLPAIGVGIAQLGEFGMVTPGEVTRSLLWFMPGPLVGHVQDMGSAATGVNWGHGLTDTNKIGDKLSVDERTSRAVRGFLPVAGVAADRFRRGLRQSQTPGEERATSTVKGEANAALEALGLAPATGKLVRRTEPWEPAGTAIGLTTEAREREQRGRQSSADRQRIRHDAVSEAADAFVAGERAAGLAKLREAEQALGMRAGTLGMSGAALRAARKRQEFTAAERQYQQLPRDLRSVTEPPTARRRP